ncbi:MAG: peptidoglycan-associated lipoprotein Pal [Pseudomonadota bacterium]
MSKLSSYFIILCVSVAVAGCGGRKSVEENIEVESVGGTAGLGSGDGSTSATGLGGDDGSGSSSLDGSGGFGGDGDLLSKRVVYFEYDSSVLTLEGEAIVQAHAQYLSASPGVQIILEGHADERGTREYNLALAEDRAKSVADVMSALGVTTSRVQTVSYGEERPVSLGSDEASWGLNRRVEILYQ